MLYSKIAESDIGEVNRNPKQGRLSLTVLRFTQQNEWKWHSGNLFQKRPGQQDNGILLNALEILKMYLKRH